MSSDLGFELWRLLPVCTIAFISLKVRHVPERCPSSLDYLQDSASANIHESPPVRPWALGGPQSARGPRRNVHERMPNLILLGGLTVPLAYGPTLTMSQRPTMSQSGTGHLSRLQTS